jgi:NitT/TauT family transport system substrate-binding protein
VCEAPLYAAHENGFFAKQGLNVTIVRAASGEDTHPAVGSGKYAATSGIFFSWLKPIEQGVDVKLVAGLHEGCLRLIVRDDGSITDLKQLRGKKIGVSGLSSSALNFFSLDLLDVGIVPSPEAKQVEWVVIDNDLLPTALAEGRVDAIAAVDPIALLATLKFPAREIANNRQGLNAQQYCCATAINGSLVREDPDTVRKLVTAWAEGSRWVGSNIEETARIEVEKKYVAGEVDQIIPILKTYSYNPSANNLRAALIPGIEKFAGTGFLDERTKAPELADKVYADLGLNW